MSKSSFTKSLLGAGLAVAVIAAGASIVATMRHSPVQAQNPAGPPQAVPVSVATVETRDIITWEDFSGRLEAVERVEVRPRVSGVIQAVHFREGALVKQGDKLITIDPAPFAAEEQERS
jgi:multidrug efflux system membrane fusion protein